MIEFVLAVAVVAAAVYAYKHYSLKSSIKSEIAKVESAAVADYAKVVAAIKAKL